MPVAPPSPVNPCCNPGRMLRIEVSADVIPVIANLAPGPVASANARPSSWNDSLSAFASAPPFFIAITIPTPSSAIGVSTPIAVTPIAPIAPAAATAAGTSATSVATAVTLNEAILPSIPASALSPRLVSTCTSTPTRLGNATICARSRASPAAPPTSTSTRTCLSRTPAS